MSGLSVLGVLGPDAGLAGGIADAVREARQGRAVVAVLPAATIRPAAHGEWVGQVASREARPPDAGDTAQPASGARTGRVLTVA